jgi:hypothetical protein
MKIDQLSHNLLMYVAEYLSMQEYLSMILVNKKFKQIMNDNSKFWTRECTRKYFSLELDSFSEFYESDAYRAEIKQKMENSHNKNWRKCLEEGLRIKQTLRNLLNMYISEDDTTTFLNYFYETFQRPCIPIPKLKRENVICSTKSMFQNKLSEVLYEDEENRYGKNIFCYDTIKQIIDQLKKHESTFEDQLNNVDRPDILKARWYTFEPKEMSETSLETLSNGEKIDLMDFQGNRNNANEETQIIGQKNASYLLQLYEAISQAIAHQCSMYFEYLCSLDNIYDVLAEYSTRWNVFVAAALELDNILEAFCQLMNKTYEKQFEHYPCYPKFSIWRLMVKIWFREVYEKPHFSQALQDAFLTILANHREKNVKGTLTTNLVEEFAPKNIKTLYDMPKSLYLSLHKQFDKKSSPTSNYTSGFNFNNLSSHCYFDECSDHERNLLSKYIQSIVDLSLNEVNIHYADCSDMNTNYPFADLEDSLIKNSQEFYEDNSTHFAESPNYFFEFLRNDMELLTEILNDKTLAKMKGVQVQGQLKYLQDFVKTEFSDTDKCDKQNTELVNEMANLISQKLNGEITNFLENILQENQQGNNEGMELETTLKLPLSIMELEKPLRQPQAKLMTPPKFMAHLEVKCPNISKHLTEINKQLKKMDEIKNRNQTIRNYNTAKNIPADLGDMDSFFYDLDKNVDPHILQKLHDDYMKEAGLYIEPLQIEEQQQNTMNLLVGVSSKEILEPSSSSLPPNSDAATNFLGSFNSLNDNSSQLDEELELFGQQQQAMTNLAANDMMMIIETTDNNNNNQMIIHHHNDDHINKNDHSNNNSSGSSIHS